MTCFLSLQAQLEIEHQLAARGPDGVGGLLFEVGLSDDGIGDFHGDSVFWSEPVNPVT
jgi:hypothetical protein